MNTRKLLKNLVVLAIVISSVFVLTGCGKKENNSNENKTETMVAEKPYLQPLVNYFEGIQKKDRDQILKAFPEFENMGENITDDDIEGLYSQYEASFGANIKFDYAFGDATALDDEKLTEFEQELASLYPDQGTIDITAGYLVPVTVTITGDNVTDSNNTTENTTEDANNTTESTTPSNVEQEDTYVLQYNGSWYIM